MNLWGKSRICCILNVIISNGDFVPFAVCGAHTRTLLPFTSDCPQMSHSQQIFRVRNLMVRSDSFSTNFELLSQEILDFRNF